MRNAVINESPKLYEPELGIGLHGGNSSNSGYDLQGALRASKVKFNRHRIRIKNVESPQPSYFFQVNQEKEKNVNWVVGLTTAHILYGFKASSDIDVIFRERESLKPLSDVLYVFGIEGLYNHLNKASVDDIYNWLSPILSETKSDYCNGFIDDNNPDYWLHQLVEKYDTFGYPLDANLFNVYMLNIIKLPIGQALKIKSYYIYMPISGSYLEVTDHQQSLCEFDVDDWLYNREYETDLLKFRTIELEIKTLKTVL
ncbi:hypothetical protein [Photobacterium satsumensis]|uniref:hypothetical protein n=1 Tax=Photobacterium satsumensis TaxID=2910239 RepID=UPI003D0F94B4